MFFVEDRETEDRIAADHIVVTSDLYGVRTVFLGVVDERSILGNVLTADNRMYAQTNDLLCNDFEVVEPIEADGVLGQLRRDPDSYVAILEAAGLSEHIVLFEEAPVRFVSDVLELETPTITGGMLVYGGITSEERMPTNTTAVIEIVRRVVLGADMNDAIATVPEELGIVMPDGTHKDPEVVAVAKELVSKGVTVSFACNAAVSMYRDNLIGSVEITDKIVEHLIGGFSIEYAMLHSSEVNLPEVVLPPDARSISEGIVLYDNIDRFKWAERLAKAMGKSLSLSSGYVGAIDMSEDIKSTYGGHSFVVHASNMSNMPRNAPEGATDVFRDIVTGNVFAYITGDKLVWTKTDEAAESMILRYEKKYDEVVEYERGLYTGIIKKTRDAFEKMTTTSVEEARAEFMRELESAENEYEKAKQESVMAANNLRRAKLKFDSFKPDDALKNNSKNIDMWFDTIKTDKRILFAGIVNNVIEIYTRTMFVEAKDGWHEVGKFIIKVNPENGHVTFENLTRKVTGFQPAMHGPHIWARGEACLGNAKSALEKAAQQGNIAQLINIAVTFTESVNESDAAGQLVIKWPKVTKETVDSTREKETSKEFVDNNFITKDEDNFNAIGLFLRRR